MNVSETLQTSRPESTTKTETSETLVLSIVWSLGGENISPESLSVREKGNK